MYQTEFPYNGENREESRRKYIQGRTGDDLIAPVRQGGGHDQRPQAQSYQGCR